MEKCSRKLSFVSIYRDAQGRFYPDFWSQISSKKNLRTLKDLEEYGMKRQTVEEIFSRTYRANFVLQNCFKSMTEDPTIINFRKAGEKIIKQYDRAIETLKKLESYKGIFSAVKLDIEYLRQKKQGMAFVHQLKNDSWSCYGLIPKSMRQMFCFQAFLLFAYLFGVVKNHFAGHGLDFQKADLYLLLSEIFEIIYSPTFNKENFTPLKLKELCEIHLLPRTTQKKLEKQVAELLQRLS